MRRAYRRRMTPCTYLSRKFPTRSKRIDVIARFLFPIGIRDIIDNLNVTTHLQYSLLLTSATGFSTYLRRERHEPSNCEHFLNISEFCHQEPRQSMILNKYFVLVINEYCIITIIACPHSNFSDPSRFPDFSHRNSHNDGRQ